jgi:hypothetical protein
MPDYLRPSLLELDARIQADLSAMPAVLREPLSHTWARACHGLHGHLDWIDRQCNPLTCELERLYDWAALYGVARLPSPRAIGTALATGSPGSVILADTLLRGANGLNYRVVAANFMANSGVANVSLRSVDTGEDGNLPAGAKLTLIDPLPGVASTLTVDDEGVTGGAQTPVVDRLFRRPAGHALVPIIDVGRRHTARKGRSRVRLKEQMLLDALGVACALIQRPGIEPLALERQARGIEPTPASSGCVPLA